MRHVLAIALLLTGFGGGPAAAQVVGTVLDSAGVPLPGVRVELWSGTLPTFRRVSDAHGNFSFSVQEAAGATGLLARLPGYRAGRAAVAPPARLTLRLAADPVALQAMTAVASRHLRCPEPDVPEARELWRAATSRYGRALDTLRSGSVFRADERTVASGSEVGTIPTEQPAQLGGVGNPAMLISTEGTLMRSGGYAFRAPQGYGAREFGAWIYPLGSIPMHLITDDFGALHTFAVAGRSSAGVRIAFCPRPGTLPGRPRVQGTIWVSSRDTLFSEASLTFTTPAPDEEAGLEITFAPATHWGSPLPLPATELFWRRPVGSKRYFQRVREYVEWKIGTDQWIPMLRRYMEGVSVRPDTT